MKIATRPVDYLIDTTHGPERVSGEAIDLPWPWTEIRLCVRRMTPLEVLWYHEAGARRQRVWRIDHFHSGRKLDEVVPPQTSKSAAIRDLLRWLPTASAARLDRLREAR
jgi:hypothetical protein